MSPKTKKMLMIAAAAVGGYIVYTKVIKKPAAAPAQIPVTSATAALKSAAINAATAQIQKLSGIQEALGVEEELGITESLGSLGGSCFR